MTGDVLFLPVIVFLNELRKYQTLHLKFEQKSALFNIVCHQLRETKIENKTERERVFNAQSKREIK